MAKALRKIDSVPDAGQGEGDARRREEVEVELPSRMPPVDMVAFSEARSCHDLARLHEKKKLMIQPAFQRNVVWGNAEQTRFIDSLAKQLPIPSMCIGLDYKTETYQVIDGLQRISSIIRFLTDNEWSMAQVEGVDGSIAGKTPGKVAAANPRIYSRIEDALLPVTLIRYDWANKAHREYTFSIFHRLNSGGKKLTAQEIRNCIYAGAFNDLLRELVDSEVARKLFGIREGRVSRFGEEESVLRFFAFADDYLNYKGNMTRHLNDYMDEKSKMGKAELRDKKAAMLRTLELVCFRILEGEAWGKSKAVMDAVAAGVYRNIGKLEGLADAELRRRYDELLGCAEFQTERMQGGIGSKAGVGKRIAIGMEIFGR